MSFQAYLDTIKAKTGLDPDDFHRAAETKGLLAQKPAATQFVAWLAADYDLGRGHAMALWAVFKGKGWAETGKNGKAGKA